MRILLAGLLLLVPVSVSFGQVADGEVTSIGFGSYYRPNCWTPMKIRLRPKSAEAGTYQIRVVQKDLDSDRVSYVRTISLGRAEGAGGDVQFWTYFVPQPTSGGLPNPGDGSTLADLKSQLIVHLTTREGRVLDQINLTSAIHSVDPRNDGFVQSRGKKLILCVSDSSPLTPDYSAIRGVVEDAIFVRVTWRDLPDNPIGYDAVDAVVWMNADHTTVADPGTLEALRDYVRSGGTLIISQNAAMVPALLQEQSSRRNGVFRSLLPVTIQGVEERTDLAPLRALAEPINLSGQDREARGTESLMRTIDREWSAATGPFRLTRAEAHPSAIVDAWIDWSGDGMDRTPFIVRDTFGLGAVTWIAMDLSDPSITRTARTGWTYIWERVFDWKNDPIEAKSDEEARLLGYQPAYGNDLSAAFAASMELTSKAAAFVFVAIAFFIVYWLVAGPGVYFLLATRKKTHLSWFGFAASAAAATLLTVIIVQLIVRGRGEIRHLSIMRNTPGMPAMVQSRLGLYIPKDGMQDLTLHDAAPGGVNFIVPFMIHPRHLGDATSATANLPYTISVPAPLPLDMNETAYTLSVPYRSTLKKFSAQWSGERPGIQGAATLIPRGWIDGVLTNATGHDLRNIHVAFKYPTPRGSEDWVLYVRDWKKGTTLDLHRLFNTGGSADATGKPGNTPFIGRGEGFRRPTDASVVRGRIRPNAEWTEYWYDGVSAGNFGDEGLADLGDRVPRSFAMLSFFDRLPPKRGTRENAGRVELKRFAGRGLDLSHAIAAGGMVVIAEADGAMPLPFAVEGDELGGDGRILFQAVLPLERSRELMESLDAKETDVEAAPAATMPVEPTAPFDAK